MNATEHDMRRQIRRLATTFNASKHEDEILASWQWLLSDVTATELMTAVGTYAKSASRFFPTPGQLREIVSAERRGNAATLPHDGSTSSDWNQDQSQGGCPVCGAMLQLAADPNLPADEIMDARTGQWRKRSAADPERPKRLRVLHDGWAHKAANVPAVGDVIWPAQRRALPPGNPQGDRRSA